MRIDRHRFFTVTACTAGGAAIARFPAGAAEYTWRWALDVAPTHQIGARSIEAAANIGKDTGGRMDVKVFPLGMLGGQSEVVGQVRLGAIELCSSGDFLSETIAPVAAMSTIPFSFTTNKEAWAAMDGPLGKMINAALAKAGVHAFESSWDAGFRQVWNSQRPIRVAADLKGLKLRIPPSPEWTALFKELGMTPTAISSNEIYTSLQTHLIDACELPFVAYQTLKLFEVTKFGSITNHSWGGYRMLMNPDTWQKLPKDLQTIVAKNINTGGLRTRTDSVHNDETLLTQIRGEGIVVNTCDINSFKTAVRATGLYQQWRAKYGAEAWALLEKTTGPLA